MENKRGISLIILAITIIVMLILVAVISFSAANIIEDSKKTAFAEDLTIIEDAISAYYLANGVLPVVDSVQYTREQIVAMTASDRQETLNGELTLNNDYNSTFYEVDLAKIEVKSTIRGTKADSNVNDIYVVNASGTKVYYPIGISVSGEKYFSKTNRLVPSNQINNDETVDNSIITIGSTTEAIKAYKTEKVWTNNLNVVVSTEKSETQTVRYIIAGVTADAHTISNISNSAPATITIGVSMTANEKLAFTNETTPNKKLAIQKLDSSQSIIAETVLDISNLDIEKPNEVETITTTFNSYSDFNTVVISPIQDKGGSSFSHISYIYTRKLNSEGNIVPLYTEEQITSLKTTGGSQIASTGYRSNSATIKVSKEIREILAVVVDNAGNISDVYTIQVDTNIMEKVGNAPVLAPGMTPIKWDLSGNILNTTASDPNWYDYANKKWANAVTADGSVWVWIPRYEYKITTPNSSTGQTIAVNFLKDTLTTTTAGYTLHPAFTFGSTGLTGIWVAKFEASGTTSSVTSKPGQAALVNITMNNAFTACRNMETTNGNIYGWGTSGNGIDVHLIKNVEWGAVAYLSSSTFGNNSKVEVNLYAGYYTGGGTEAAYVTNIAQSSTGNVYGVYDMSGGAWEYVAAYVNNSDGTLTTNGASITNASAKYKDIYTVTTDSDVNNYNNASGKKGDAIYETSSAHFGTNSWYTEFSYMPFLTTPFFIRSGGISSGNNAGIFCFKYYAGTVGASVGFRPVLLVNSVL